MEINLVVFLCNFKEKSNKITTRRFDELLKLEKLSRLTFDLM